MINSRHHCLNMALELELSTLPQSTVCDRSDMEPVSPPLPAGVCSWGSVKPPPRLKETGLSSLAEITRGAEKRLFEVLLSDHLKCRLWNGFGSLTQGSRWTSTAAGRENFAPRCSLLVGVWGCWSPAAVGEEVGHRHSQKRWWFASSAQV